MHLTTIRDQYLNKIGRKFNKLLRYYSDDPTAIPIYKRIPKTKLKSNFHTNLHIDFAGMIVDFKVGYMGKDIETLYRGGDENINKIIKDWNLETNQSGKNSESVELSSVCGLSFRLLYLNKGKLRVKNIPADRVVLDYDDDIYDPLKAYYYTEDEDYEYCDIYDDRIIEYWKKKKKDRLNKDWVKFDEQLHLLGEIPIIPFENNSKWDGDFEKSITTIDAYDEIISDLVSEIKSIRGNYFILSGQPLIKKEQEEIPIEAILKENNLVLMPLDAEGRPSGDMKILDVNIPDEAIQNTLQVLRQHIFEESNSVDIKQITQSKDARVFTIKTTLMPVENNCMTTENYFKMGFRKQYRIFANYINNSGQGFVDYRDIQITFNRNFHGDPESQARLLSILMQNTSVEDAYRISELFDDVTLAVSRYKEEQGLLDGES